MATAAQKAKIKKLQAQVDAQIKNLKPQVAAVQKKVDPLGYAVSQAQQTYDKAKAGTSGTAIKDALQGLSAAKTSLAQDRASKPELDALSIARGDTTQWNPKTQQYQLIKGPNQVTQKFNMDTKQWEFGTGGTGGGDTGGTGGDNGAAAAADAAAKEAAAARAADAAEKAATKKATRENATSSLIALFTRYGLGSLAGKISELVIQYGADMPDTIQLKLSETQEYKTRFKANDVRIKNGTSVLTPGEYLAYEDEARQVLRAYGLNQFDNDEYITGFIENDMSKVELNNRIVTAVQRVQNADPAIMDQLTNYYGIAKTDLVAYVLDPSKQFETIQRQVEASEIGSAASRQGLTAGRSVAEQLASQGVTQEQANKGYSDIANILPTANKLSDIYGGQMDTYGQAEAEQETFNGLASAQRKRQKLAATEVGTFSGSSGVNKSSLSSGSQGYI